MFIQGMPRQPVRNSEVSCTPACPFAADVALAWAVIPPHFHALRETYLGLCGCMFFVRLGHGTGARMRQVSHATDSHGGEKQKWTTICHNRREA